MKKCLKNIIDKNNTRYEIKINEDNIFIKGKSIGVSYIIEEHHLS